MPPTPPVLLSLDAVDKLPEVAKACVLAEGVLKELCGSTTVPAAGDAVNQAVRSSSSVAANLYEAQGRGMDTGYVLNHYRIASGSAYETAFWLRYLKAPTNLQRLAANVCDVLRECILKLVAKRAEAALEPKRRRLL